MFWFLFFGFISIFSLIGGAFNGLASLKDMNFSGDTNTSDSKPNTTLIIIAILVLWLLF